MRPTPTNPRIPIGKRPPSLGMLVLLLLGVILGPAMTPDRCPAQTALGQGDLKDLEFLTVNATTGEPVQVSKVRVDYLTARPNNILEVQPSGANITAVGIPVIEGGQYIITAWYRGVPYWWSMRGRELADGKRTLHVFDTSTDLSDITIKGMNLVVRRQESVLSLEYLVQLDNQARPQVTVYDPTGTIEIRFPAGVGRLEAVYERGTDPTTIETRFQGTDRLALAVPLTPGNNRIVIKASLPWTDGMEIPVGGELGVESWSILASPDWMKVTAAGLESTMDQQVQGYSRFRGPSLEAGRSYPLRLNSGIQPAGTEEDVFTKPVDPDLSGILPGVEEEKSGGISLPLVFAGVMIIIIVAAVIRRRRQS